MIFWQYCNDSFKPLESKLTHSRNRNDYVSCKRIMLSSAVLLFSDLNFFFVNREGKSVFDLVRGRATGAACYGILERKLSKAESMLEDMLRFIHALGVSDVMVILCLGQHEVLDCINQERFGAAVSAIIALVEKYWNKMVVCELVVFESTFMCIYLLLFFLVVSSLLLAG